MNTVLYKDFLLVTTLKKCHSTLRFQLKYCDLLGTLSLLTAYRNNTFLPLEISESRSERPLLVLLPPPGMIYPQSSLCHVTGSIYLLGSEQCHDLKKPRPKTVPQPCPLLSPGSVSPFTILFKAPTEAGILTYACLYVCLPLSSRESGLVSTMRPGSTQLEVPFPALRPQASSLTSLCFRSSLSVGWEQDRCKHPWGTFGMLPGMHSVLGCTELLFQNVGS